MSVGRLHPFVPAAAPPSRKPGRPSSPPPLLPLRSSQLLRAFSRPPGKVYLLYGNEFLFRLSLLMAARATADGSSIAIVDGGNRFDVHLIIRFARERGIDPDLLLHRIFISRGFTCYQMEQAIVGRLPAFLAAVDSHTALVFGLLDTFYDEQAPLREVRQILHRVLVALRQMKADGVSVLIACREYNVRPEERNALLTALKAGVDRVYRLELNPAPSVVLEKGEPHHGTYRTDLHQRDRQRAGRLGQVPPGPAQGRPGAV